MITEIIMEDKSTVQWNSLCTEWQKLTQEINLDLRTTSTTIATIAAAASPNLDLLEAHCREAPIV